MKATILSVVFLKRKSGICRGKTGHRTTLSFKNKCALLTWESPSNFGQLIVIQTVLFVLFSGIYLCVIEKWYSDPGDCHTRKADWFAMTGDSINPNLLRKPVSAASIPVSGEKVTLPAVESPSGQESSLSLPRESQGGNQQARP